MVGVWNDDAEKYHLYVTNLSIADYSASDIAQLYRARWEVELLFKELKSTCHLDQIFDEQPRRGGSVDLDAADFAGGEPRAARPLGRNRQSRHHG
ncbi:hypothetical protein BRC81_04925 [Halobacteriales archaeon QS_1_68_20]|nr:MAG: hypothetical protein BRC81_04925 [Halobacteriales archaeon QS_1_68_20]